MAEALFTLLHVPVGVSSSLTTVAKIRERRCALITGEANKVLVIATIAVDDDLSIRSLDLSDKVEITLSISPQESEGSVSASSEVNGESLGGATGVVLLEVGVGASPAFDGLFAEPDESDLIRVGDGDGVVAGLGGVEERAVVDGLVLPQLRGAAIVDGEGGVGGCAGRDTNASGLALVGGGGGMEESGIEGGEVRRIRVVECVLVDGILQAGVITGLVGSGLSRGTGGGVGSGRALSSGGCTFSSCGGFSSGGSSLSSSTLSSGCSIGSSGGGVSSGGSALSSSTLSGGGTFSSGCGVGGSGSGILSSSSGGVSNGGSSALSSCRGIGSGGGGVNSARIGGSSAGSTCLGSSGTSGACLTRTCLSSASLRDNHCSQGGRALRDNRDGVARAG